MPQAMRMFALVAAPLREHGLRVHVRQQALLDPPDRGGAERQTVLILHVPREPQGPEIEFGLYGLGNQVLFGGREAFARPSWQRPFGHPWQALPLAHALDSPRTGGLRP